LPIACPWVAVGPESTRSDAASSSSPRSRIGVLLPGEHDLLLAVVVQFTLGEEGDSVLHQNPDFRGLLLLRFVHVCTAGFEPASRLDSPDPVGRLPPPLGRTPQAPFDPSGMCPAGLIYPAQVPLAEVIRPCRSSTRNQRLFFLLRLRVHDGIRTRVSPRWLDPVERRARPLHYVG